MAKSTEFFLKKILSAGIEPATARYLFIYSRALYQLSYERSVFFFFLFIYLFIYFFFLVNPLIAIGYTCYKNTVKGAAIKYPPDMKRSDEIRIANFRTGCHPLMQNWRKAIICPFCHSAPSNQLHLLVGCPSQKLDAARYEILGFSTLTGKWDRSSDLILINGIPASLGSIFATSWLPSVAMLIRWMEQASNLRLWNCVGDT